MAYRALDSVPSRLERLLRNMHYSYRVSYLLNRNSYRFRADQYGTSWYHSHYSSQYAGGILGPMIIHGPGNYDYDIDLGPVFLQDCNSHPLCSKKRQSDNDLGFHKDYFTIVEQRRSLMVPIIAKGLLNIYSRERHSNAE